MSKFKDYQIGPDHKVVVNLSDVLGPDHLCLRMEQIISGLDVRGIESEYSNLGRNALHPKMMLCIIFYGYATGIRSGRKLATACKEQFPFMYLSKNCQPKKTSINHFRMQHYLHFADLFGQVLKACQREGLGDSSITIVDGSKLLANSSMRRTKNQKQLEKWRQTLSDDIASLNKEMVVNSEAVKKN